MISKRDIKIREFFDINKFKAAKTSTLHELFFKKKNGKHTSLRYAQNRLKELCEYKELKRLERTHFTDEYVYYRKHPRNMLKHSLLLTDFYREFNKLVNIFYFEAEKKIEHLICDGIVAYEVNGDIRIAFVEVQTRNAKVDIGKYKKLLLTGKYDKLYPECPIMRIIAITNRKVENWDHDRVEIYKIGENLSGIDCLIDKIDRFSDNNGKFVVSV